MKILQLVQGSPEWLAHRRTTRNASEAPAMMGASPYVSRAELVRQKATGVERDIDAATQRVFDRGHAVEPALRALAESIIGEDLYPITGVSDDGHLGASFDGVTIGEDCFIEAKQSNAEKFGLVLREEIPPQDYWQIVQQFAVCESATRCLYLVGDGTYEGTAWLMIARPSIADDIPKLIESWRQFDADVAAYVQEAPEAPAPTGHAPKALQALHIELRGEVTASNLAEFKETALGAIRAVNRDLQTDEDFADAEQSAKWCSDVESRIEAAKQHALSQTRSIDELFRTMDEISAEARRVRLDLDKLVKARKESIRAEIVQKGRESVQAHVAAINLSLGEHAIGVPAGLSADLAAAIKGKRTLSSMRDAVDTAAASAKIAASQQAERIRACIAVLDEHAEHAALFPDRVFLCAAKLPDDLRNLAAARIAEHQRREQAKLEAERERIRAEESAKAKAEAEQAARDAEPPKPASVPPAAPAQTVAFTAATTTARSVPAGNAPALIKLGEINDAIAPLQISAEGLAQLGFAPARTDRAAKLYAQDDLIRICETLSKRLSSIASRFARAA